MKLEQRLITTRRPYFNRAGSPLNHSTLPTTRRNHATMPIIRSLTVALWWKRWIRQALITKSARASLMTTWGHGWIRARLAWFATAPTCESQIWFKACIASSRMMLCTVRFTTRLPKPQSTRWGPETDTMTWVVTLGPLSSLKEVTCLRRWRSVRTRPYDSRRRVRRICAFGTISERRLPIASAGPSSPTRFTRVRETGSTKSWSRLCSTGKC